MPEAIQFPRPARRLERRRIINDTTIRSIKPPANGTVGYFDDLPPGLSLRITANDVRTWTVFYRDKNARQKRLTLGRYPAVKLVDARELARDAQRSVAHGGDPVTEKRTAREVLTFGKLAEKYREAGSVAACGNGAEVPPESVCVRVREVVSEDVDGTRG